MKLDINTTFKSPNSDERVEPIDTLVIHSTHMPFKESLDRLCDANSKVSCHYIIDINGVTYRLIEDVYRAWHCGLSCWKGRDKVNDFSIGIELVDCAPDGERLTYFSAVQMDSCIKLCNHLIKKHNISLHNVVAHSDIAPSRKDDPGEFFNWALLSKHGAAIHHDIILTDINGSRLVIEETEKSERVLDIQNLLSKFGYNVVCSGIYDENTIDVVIAFKRRFYPEKVDSSFDQNAYNILKDIVSKI